jgi:branched-chain amino acid transport system substrate-binding protein
MPHAARGNVTRRRRGFSSRALLLLTIVALVAAACRGSEGEGDGDDVITFGSALSLTGDTATEGQLVRDGYDFMVKHINDAGGIEVGDQTYTIEIKYYDDQSDADTSVRLYERLIVEDEVDFLLGPYGDVTLPVSAVSERHQIPMVVAHAATTSIYEQGFKYLFATLATVENYTGPMLEMATTLDPPVETVALVNENALFPQAGIDAAAEQAEELGIEVVYNENFPTGTRDLTPLISSVKNLDPDMMIVGHRSTAEIITFVKQSVDQDLDVPLRGYLLGPTLPGFVEDLGDEAEGALEPIQWDPTLEWEDQFFGWSAQEWADLFEEEFGYTPDYHPPQSAAALEVYMDALQRAGTLDRQAVRDAIAETDIMTFYGPVKFNQNGQNDAKGMPVVQIQSGAPEIVWPEEVATADLLYSPPS